MSVSLVRIAAPIVTCLFVVACSSFASPGPSAVSTPSQPSETSPTAAAPNEPSPSVSVAPQPTADAGTWLVAGELVEPRNATSAVALGTGEVLVVGSDYQTSWMSACGASTDGSDSVEIGDPLTGVWERTTSLPRLRDAPAVVALPDGKALLTGGAAGESIGWSANSSTYVFDPTSREWSRSGLLNTARTLTAATVLTDGRVLVAGGMFMDRASPDVRVLDTAELWDPRSGTWSLTGRLAQTRFRATAVTLADGRVLVVGGPESRESDPIPLASAEVFNPDTGRWTAAGRLATARNGFALIALADGGAIAAGGIGSNGSTGGSLAVVERFDSVANSWSSAIALPYPVAGAAGIRMADGRVLLAGGSVRPPESIDENAGTYATGFTADVLLFDAETGTWTQTASMPSPRAGASAVLLADGSVVVVGGSIGEGHPSETPGCPEAHPQVVRYVPG